VSILYTDSLVDGSGVVLGDEGAQGKSFFLDIPQSIVRSYQVKGGILGKYRLHLQPAFFYSYARHSLQYPSGGEASHPYNRLSDRQNTVSSVNALVSSDSSSFFFYSGGLRIDLEKEEKLFQNTVDIRRFVDMTNSDTFGVKLNDYKGYRAIMKQVASLRAPSGIGIDYSYNISRYLKTYPNYYFKKNEITGNSSSTVWIDTIRSNEDKDWIIQDHHLSITPIKGARAFLSIIGEYSTNLSYNLKKEKSVNNSVDYFYLIGGNSFFYPSDNLRLELSATADVKRTNFVFLEKYLQIGLGLPSYSREMTVELVSTWRMDKRNKLRLEWREHYEDDGNWYDINPADSAGGNTDSIAADFTPYYGIERIQWRHSFELNDSLAINPYFLCVFGSSLEYIYQTRYNNFHGGYKMDASQTRYVVIPYVTLDAMINQYFTLKARIKRTIDTVKDDYWDFTIFFSAKF
jgi:hypothetical protein